MRHLIDPMDLSLEELDEILELGEKIYDNPEAYSELAKGKKIATLFYEPSTRTRLSFESAMLDLGGNVIGFSSATDSSVSKGESVEDTVRTVGCFADVIAMRHPNEGATSISSTTINNGSVKLIAGAGGGSAGRGGVVGTYAAGYGGDGGNINSSTTSTSLGTVFAGDDGSTPYSRGQGYKGNTSGGSCNGNADSGSLLAGGNGRARGGGGGAGYYGGGGGAGYRTPLSGACLSPFFSLPFIISPASRCYG